MACLGLAVTLAFGCVGAYAATDSATNDKGVRSSQVKAGASADESVLLDDNGATPADAIEKLIEAQNAADWQKVYYDLSAYTAWCYEYVRADLACRAPKYSDFKVKTIDFIQLDASKYARVEVSFTLTYKDRASGETKTLSRDGDWWTVFTEGGVWKVEYANWTPGGAYNAQTPSDPDVTLAFAPQKSIHSIIRFSY
jgi:hypothetical protein